MDQHHNGGTAEDTKLLHLAEAMTGACLVGGPGAGHARPPLFPSSMEAASTWTWEAGKQRPFHLRGVGRIRHPARPEEGMSKGDMKGDYVKGG